MQNTRYRDGADEMLGVECAYLPAVEWAVTVPAGRRQAKALPQPHAGHAMAAAAMLWLLTAAAVAWCIM
jgi:hypothetical protein